MEKCETFATTVDAFFSVHDMSQGNSFQVSCRRPFPALRKTELRAIEASHGSGAQ